MRIYNNAISVNHGLKLDGPAPLDDRLVVDTMNDIYVDASNPEDCPFYGNLYAGAPIVVIENGEAKFLILMNDEPYREGIKITVSAQNYLNYWKSIDKELYDSLFFDGGSDPDSQYTITPTGTIPSGTTIGQLETMTLSEILKKILFEFVEPHKIQDSAFSASLTGDYAAGKAVEVGADYPTSANFSTSYKPEQWQWVSAVNSTVKGPVASLST